MQADLPLADKSRLYLFCRPGDGDMHASLSLFGAWASMTLTVKAADKAAWAKALRDAADHLEGPGEVPRGYG